MFPTSALALIYSVLIFSILFIPFIHLNILISVLSTLNNVCTNNSMLLCSKHQLVFGTFYVLFTLLNCGSTFFLAFFAFSNSTFLTLHVLWCFILNISLLFSDGSTFACRHCRSLLYHTRSQRQPSRLHANGVYPRCNGARKSRLPEHDKDERHQAELQSEP